MEESKKPSRTSRCREWERQRRNKFKDALNKLGEVVKSVNRANDANLEDSENVQYPKIEIVQKAIICLTNCVQEKTQLKGEILALQVKLESKIDRKDASTQVFIKINKKPSPKARLTRPIKPNSNIDGVAREKSLCKLPKLLPRSKLSEKKGPENTIVVLPAAPYIFPPRPVLFPTMPPTFVLVDSNLQALNKASIPTLNRTNNEVTKTTMVNILPISAYSRPLSATKSKKSNIKLRNETNKKLKMKSKSGSKPDVDVNSKDSEDPKQVVPKQNVQVTSNNSDKENTMVSEEIKLKENVSEPQLVAPVAKELPVKIDNQTSNIILSNIETKSLEISDVLTPVKINELPDSKDSNDIPVSLKMVDDKSENKSEHLTKEKENNKAVVEKVVTTERKEDKLSTILETTLCEHNVDGGNARLELAEEFLAASPTAAFLLSFPLVSGNRADSPAEEAQNVLQSSKDSSQKRNDISSQSENYYDKQNNTDSKPKSTTSKTHSTNITNKQSDQQKFVQNNVVKQVEIKPPSSAATGNVTTENPFLNLPSLVPTSCPLPDATFGFDFDCSLNKSVASSTNYVNNSNLFYKSDPFSSVKSTIYSTSSISSGHEFNSIGLYPCAMEKYNHKTKSDYHNVDDNIMKIGSSRLTYDIDLGWSHKSFDFVNCSTTSNNFSKDSILTSVSAPYSTSYNPFNPDFHVSLVSNKKESSSKTSSSFADTITSFYSQPTNLWSEEPFYSSASINKALVNNKEHSNYHSAGQSQSNVNPKSNNVKQYESKSDIPEIDNRIKISNVGINTTGHQSNDKYKKSPHKMHINWMTSEVRSMQNTYLPSNIEQHKEVNKNIPNHIEHVSKKHENVESNYFPITIHNYTSQPAQEEFQVWPSTRPLGTTEITMEPPPINLPTLVGDLALGPHDKKKNADMHNRGIPSVVNTTDAQNCNNFFSVTQLMNRSSDMSSRYQGSNTSKPIVKQNLPFPTDGNRKVIPSRLDTVPTTQTQPCYVFNDTKPSNTYGNVNQYPNLKSKTSKTDKTAKAHKNNYSAESLIRGGTCSQKIQENNSAKFVMPSQKYPDYSVQDSSVAQISHYPPILDYSDNSYASQQLSGTTLYNSTTNTLSNTFYTNFMQGTSNLMPTNYTSGPFSSDYVDYNQSTECNYTNHKYEDLKIRNNQTIYHQDKVPLNYKSSRRESTTKHKLECSKKDSSKKYHSKRVKVSNDAEEWSETNVLPWQNKTSNKRHPNLVTDELPYPNYVGNQMATQYQPEYFNTPLLPSAVQGAAGQTERTLSSFPISSRANFNLSTIFPEITMKVQ